jgi:hypothetical protein
MAIVTLGRTIHGAVACLANVVTEILVDLDFGRLALMALGAISTQLLLVSLVVEGDVTFAVLVGDYVSSGCNADADKDQQDRDQYQFLHFLPPFS